MDYLLDYILEVIGGSNVPTLDTIDLTCFRSQNEPEAELAIASDLQLTAILKQVKLPLCIRRYRSRLTYFGSGLGGGRSDRYSCHLSRRKTSDHS